MAQRTLVLKLDPTQGRALRAKLESGPFTFRAVPHSLFSVKGDGLVATLYRSGKLVVQGPDPELFLRAWVGPVAPDVVGAAGASSGPTPAAGSGVAADEPVVGSDESGKGDYFGPLVVAAVRLEPELARGLDPQVVRDCKDMSDDNVRRVAVALRAHLPFAVARLDPPAYNAEHARVKNLNPMLAALHAQVLRELARPGERVIVDQFANAKLMEGALKGLDVRLEQRPRAEEELVVAAASVIARDEFLTALEELSEEHAVDLAKGAGSPVDRAARRFVQVHGFETLGQVAKLHFKTTQKIPGAPPDLGGSSPTARSTASNRQRGGRR